MTMGQANGLIPDDPNAVAPLRALQGRQPEYPPWFQWAINQPVLRQFVEVDGVAIDTRIWGEEGKPGILLLHGNGGNADWWGFIAPYLALDYRVVTFSFSGSGDSGWRDSYSAESFAQEIMAAAESGGLLGGEHKPVIVAHSFSGAFALLSAARHGEQLGALYLVDSALKLPKGFNALERKNPNRLYPSIDAALQRYRFSPPYICHNAYIADYIARRSLRFEDRDSESGWCWSFDPNMMSKLGYSADTSPWLDQARCPLAFIWGETSSLFHGEVADFMFALAPASTPRIAIPDAGHHVMVDQPLALIAAIRALMAGAGQQQ